MRVYLLLLWILLSISSLSFAQKPLKTISYQDIEPQLSLKEAKNVKRIFDQYTILDIDHPDFQELKIWVDKLNNRLSQAVELTGEYYPHYKIQVMVDPSPNAFIYKYRPTGQEFYRGHVFFSTGLLQNFLESFGSDFSKVTDKELEYILNGLEGVIAHEYAHPKQDELVKWDWREANESTSAPHQQMDEMATDIMGTNLLEKAGLDRRGVFRGLNMLFSERMGGHFLKRSAHAATSTHPENNLRLNINRGNLSQKRISEGTPKVERIAYDHQKLSAELSELMSYNNFKGLLKLKIEAELTFDNVTEYIYKQASQGYRIYLSKYIEVLDELYVLETENQAVNEKKFIQLIEILTKKNKLQSVAADNSDKGIKQSIKQKEKFKLYESAEVKKTLVESLKNFKAYTTGEFLGLTSIYPQSLIDQYFSNAIEFFVKEGHFKKSVIQKTFDLLNVVRAYSHDINHHHKFFDFISYYMLHPERYDFEKYGYLIINGSYAFSADKLKYYAYAYLMMTPGDARSFNSLFKKYSQTPELASQLNKKYFNLAKYLVRTGDLVNDRVLGVIQHGYYPHSLANSLKVSPGESYPLFEKEIFKLIENNRWKRNKDPRTTLINLLTKKNSTFGTEAQTKLLDMFILKDIRLENLKKRISYTRYISTRKLEHAYIDKVTSEAAFLRQKSLADTVGWMGKKLSNYYNKDKLMAYFKRHHLRGNISDQSFIDYTASLTRINSEGNRIKDFNQTNTNNIWQVLGEMEDTVEKRLYMILDTAKFSDKSEALNNFKKTGKTSKVSEYEGIKYDASYAGFVKKSRSQIFNDFVIEKGIDLNSSKSLKKNIGNFKSLSKVIFNPDNIQLNRYQQDVYSFNALDLIHYDFIKMLPEEISFNDAFEFWDTMTAKRSNRFTDSFFIKHIYGTTEAENIELREKILKSRKIRSQRILIEYLESVQKEKVDKIVSRKSPIKKSELYNLLSEIERLVPESSNFRDDYIEKLAWDLNLSEKLTSGFIEPLKSFNYKSLDMRSIKMLSLTSVLLEKMKITERLALVKHIQNPVRDIVDVIPRITKYIKEVENKHIRDGIELLEGFIRESSEMQKLVLIEMLVGTKRYGLYYQSQEVLDELFDLAGIDDKDNLKLFKTYIQTLPNYEHSIILSYLIATKSFDGLSDGESNLLKIAEAHGPVGIKGAQIADILSLFGEGHNLHLAKDQSLPATKAEIFKTLKRELSVTDYEQIKSVKTLAGSGGIKHVAIIEFKDGATEAVYLKRNHLEETIKSTLDIVRNWETILAKDPDFASDIDFKYYIDTLEKQLGFEAQFTNEFKLSKIMANKYESVKSYKGWSFKGVRPTKRFQSNNIMHFEAVQGAKKFSDLSKAEKQIVSEYIVKTEFDFLMKDGVFDADRHLGNYLFDPQNKTIYPIDFSQVYFLSKNKLFNTGDKYHVANLIRGINHQDKKKGAQIVASTLNEISLTKADAKSLAIEIEPIISDTSLEANQIFTKILAVMTNNNVKLPVKYSLGVVKGLMIISNEDYAKTVSPEYLKNIVKKHVVKQMIKSLPSRAMKGIKNTCNKLFL